MYGQDDGNGTGAAQNDAGAPAADGALAQPADQQPGGAPSVTAPMDGQAGDYLADDEPATQGDGTPQAGAAPGAVSAAPATDDLLDLKQQALQQLTPLVGHLEQSPEDEFRTTMMMIQASDNAALIKKAYAAALKITDDKARAQALLDVVNEINYFTQNQTPAAA